MNEQIETSKISSGELVKLIACSMAASIEDDKEGKGSWSLSEDGQRLVITTRFSRNPNMCILLGTASIIALRLSQLSGRRL